MRGERIIAEILSIIGLLIYVVALQHLYSELLNHPDRSWINQVRAWWVTRGSRKIEKRLRIFTLKESATEPTPGEVS